MKNKLFLYIALGCLFSTTACDKVLDVEPVSSITNASYWKAEGDVTGYVTGIYTDYRNLVNNTLHYEDRSDAFIAGLEGPVSTAWAHNLTSDNAPNWLEYYNVIHHCNLVLKFGPGVSQSPNMSRLLAQVHFMRAALYFDLIKTWGDVPIVLEPTESDDRPLPSRTPAAEVMTQILADVDKAIQLFPEQGFVNKGRVSAPAAQALKADVLLWKNKVLNGTDADLTAAVTAADAVLASGVSLVPLADIHATNKRRNAEIIFSLNFLRDEKSDHYGSRLKPRNIFVATATNVAEIPFATNGARSVYTPSPRIRALFADNDLRKANSFITAVDRSNNVMGIFDNKFRGTVYPDDRYYENDIVRYRAAEVILFKAEALAALNRVPEAVTELNKVRQRAGIGVYTGALDKQAVEAEILNERGRELWLELKRWHDLVRFHYGKTINVYQVVPNLNGKTVPLFSPIPRTQIDINPNLEQTEGYTN